MLVYLTYRYLGTVLAYNIQCRKIFHNYYIIYPTRTWYLVPVLSLPITVPGIYLV